jgi:hypothetical protein
MPMGRNEGMVVDLSKPGELAIAMLDAIVELSDRAEALGGARSIAGVAALHTLQTSIQKNKARMRQALADARKDEE